MTVERLLRIGLAAQLLGGALIALWLLPDRAAWLALPIALLVPLVGTGIVLAIEIAIGAAIDPRRPSLPLPQLIAVWWEETLISTRMFALAQLFAARFPEPALMRDAARPAVLLVHGYMCNRAVWRRFLDSGELRDCNVATVNLEPIFGPIDGYAEVVHDAIERLRAATGTGQVVLVAHSMGGLALRVYLRKYGAAAVSKAITLATPHAGTAMGSFGTGSNSREMKPGSPFLQQLAHDLAPELLAKLVCVGTRDDHLIVPRSSPFLPGARHVVFERVGHLALIEDRRAWDLLRNEIQASRAMRPTEAQRVIDSAM